MDDEDLEKRNKMNTAVCRFCGSELIQTIEMGYSVGHMDYVRFTEGGFEYDWSSVDQDVEWSTDAWQCGECYEQRKDLRELVIPARIWYLTHRTQRSIAPRTAEDEDMPF